nr:hypothetical protein CFP56_12652 [Quercus suber]
MANVGQDREELIGSQRENQFVNLERRRDRQRTLNVMVESYHTNRTERSHSRTRSHVSHDQETRKLQQEIDHLCRKLRRREHDRRSPSPSPSDGSGESRDRSYRHRSKTPSSKSYSVSSH